MSRAMTVPCIHKSTKKLLHKDKLSQISPKGKLLKAMGYVKFQYQIVTSSTLAHDSKQEKEIYWKTCDATELCS